MFTDFCFTNMSPNIHRPSVTLFQRNLFGNIHQMIAWKVIQNCHYQWTHPFQIDWAYEYQLFDAYGNVSSISPLPPDNKLRMYNDDISIKCHCDHVLFKKSRTNKIIGINLLKNRRIIATQKIGVNKQAKFELSKTLYICADLRTEEGGVIHPGNLNISLRKLDIDKKHDITLMMQGGQPGAFSKPLKFVMS